MRIAVIVAVAGFGLGGLMAESPTGNGYDVLARMAGAFEGIVFGSGNAPRALELIGTFSGAGPDAKVKAAFEYPDKIFLDVHSDAGRFRVWRDGRQAWVEPAALATHFPKARGSGASGLPADVIPLTATQLQFLPAFVRVENASVTEMEVVGDSRCRVVTFSALPELAKSFGWGAHRATLWVDEGEMPRRIEIESGGLHWVLDVKRWQWARALPSAIWRPSADHDAAPIGLDGFSQIQRLVLPSEE